MGVERAGPRDAERGTPSGEQPQDLVLERDVGGDGERRAARLGNRRHGFVQFLAPSPGNRHLDAFGRERHGDGASDAAAAAGDDGYLAGQRTGARAGCCRSARHRHAGAAANSATCSMYWIFTSKPLEESALDGSMRGHMPRAGV